MDDWERRKTRQLRELLLLMDIILWSALPQDGIFPELPANPGWRMCGAQKPTKVEGVTPVHDGCDRGAFDAVHWDIVFPGSYLEREVEGQCEIEDSRSDLIKPIPWCRRFLKTKPSELTRCQEYQLIKLSTESSAAARVTLNVATQSQRISKPPTADSASSTGSSNLMSALANMGVANEVELMELLRKGGASASLFSTAN